MRNSILVGTKNSGSIGMIDCEIPFVRQVAPVLADEDGELIVDSAWFAGVAGRRLQRHRGRTVRRQFEIKRIGIVSKLPQKSLLQSREFALRLNTRVDLLDRQVQLLAKVQSQHVQVFATVLEGRENVAEYFLVLYKVWIY